jgi:predicted ATP-grasp superfamily ATP-dependent carboligase
MRVFVGEYVCGGGLAKRSSQQIPSSMRAEGAAMLRAVVADLSDFADVVVPIDPSFVREVGDVSAVEIDATKPLWGQWVAAAHDCDAALVVAPESRGILAKAVAVLRAGGIDVVASSGDFLRVASDKLQTAKALLSAGVSHPPYITTSDQRLQGELEKHRKFVVKPRDGCGTKEIQVFDSLDDARGQLADEHLLQAWIPGDAISVAVVTNGNDQTFLPAVKQTFSQTDCEYAGGCGPLDDESQRRAMSIAARAIAAMPPTPRGFVGLDLLLGERPSEDCVIEINPRLTTSYVGLRRMIVGNLAARLLDLETGPVSCHAAVDSIRWTPDGRIWINDAVAEGA